MTESFQYKYKFFLECGEYLSNPIFEYTTYGKLNTEKSNVVWVCHALTANSDPKEWWPGLVGKDKIIDTSKYFIICVNMLGSDYGTTGARSIKPETGSAYGLNFPKITIRDIAIGLEKVREYLDIQTIHLGIGGSMGGMQLLEWAAMKKDLFENMIIIGTNAIHSPWGKAFNESQIMALESDQTFYNEDENAGKKGLEAARSVALLSYRSYGAYWRTQQDEPNSIANYRAASYQRYQGSKLSRRFHAHAYFTLVNAMNSQDLARYRSNRVETILKSIQTNMIAVGITSDGLFPPTEQHFIARHVPNAQYFEIDSPYGHDGFLIEFEKLSVIIGNILVH